MKTKGLPQTLSKNQLIDELNKMPNKPVYVSVNHTKLIGKLSGGFEGTILPISLVMHDDWEKDIIIDVDFSKPRPLSDLINEDKFKNDLLEYFGFKDATGTHIWEQTGDYESLDKLKMQKIKKNFIDGIIMILDSCRKNL